MVKTCSIPDCDRPVHANGMCGTHRARAMRGADLYAPIQKKGPAYPRPPRTAPKRERAPSGERWPCKVEGCDRPRMGWGYCEKHYQRFRKYGDPEALMIRERGTGNITPDGYRRLRFGKKNVLEHRYVMEQHLGRKLLRSESVHHINGDRLDNKLENLELWSSSHPPGQRVEDKIKWCKEFLGLYDGKV